MVLSRSIIAHSARTVGPATRSATRFGASISRLENGYNTVPTTQQSRRSLSSISIPNLHSNPRHIRSNGHHSTVPSVFQRHHQIRHLSQELRTAIDKAVKSAPVVLFMKGTPAAPQCGFSRASVQVLALHGVDPAKFAAYNVLDDQELRNGIKEYTDWQTIPQLFIDGEFVGGCDILMGMHKDGSLATMLADKGVLVPAKGDDDGSAAATTTAGETKKE